MLREVRELVKIDRERLDQEAVDNPSLVLKYSEMQADAQEEFMKAESRLEHLRAHYTLRIASAPSKYGLPKKHTVAMLAAAVTLIDKIQEAVEEVRTTKRKYNAAKNAVVALQKKGSRLDTLTELNRMNYYSDPRPPRDAEQREVRQSVRKKTLRKGIRRNRE